MKIWPILVDFTMASHLLFSNHMTMVVNFEKFLTSPGFLLILEKSSNFKELAQKL